MYSQIQIVFHQIMSDYTNYMAEISLGEHAKNLDRVFNLEKSRINVGTDTLTC